MRNPLFQQTVNRDHSGRYPATTAPISYCPRCGRWFSGLALAVGLATAAFTGAGLAHADADTDPGRPAATASADTQGTTSTASKDQAADTKTADTAGTKDSDTADEDTPKSTSPKSEDQESDEDTAPSKDDAAPDKSSTPTDTDTGTDTTTDDATEDEPTDAVTKDHSSATVEHTVAPKAEATKAEEPTTVAADEPETEVTQAVTEEPAATTTKSTQKATAKTAAVETVAVQEVASKTETTEAESTPAAPTVAVAALSAATTTTTSSNWLADFFNNMFLSWQRMFNNATPTVPSQKVNITLTDASGVSSPIAFGGTDADGDPLVYTVTSGPKYGTVTIDQTTGTFVYNPVDSATVGTINDSFTVKVDDTGFHFHNLIAALFGLDGGHGATATITLVVNPVNAAPIANADNVSGLTNSSASGNVLTNDTDREGTKLTATLVSGVSHGTLKFASDGSFTYTPTTAYTGKDSFTYTASDGVNTSAVATVTITVSSVSDLTPTGGTLTIGVQGLDWFRGLSTADTNKALDMAKAAGVTSVRLDISWFVVEATKGTYDWSSTDPLVNMVIAHQMTILGQLYDTPTWLSGSTNYHTPPADPAKFAVFAAATATHYAGKINAWEIWNEPNLTQFWPNPDPVAYTKLLKAVYPAIKAVNPNALVVTGGLGPALGTGIDGSIAFVSAMYAAGAAGYFDVLALHPYFWPALPTTAALVAAHNLMVANGDGNKQIWLTEVGAPTGTSSRAVTEKKQAQTIAVLLKFARANSYIGAIYPYSMFDTGTNLAEPEDNFGLLHRDFTPKLAWGIWQWTQEDLDTLLSSST